MPSSLLANRFARDRRGNLFDLATGWDVHPVAKGAEDRCEHLVVDRGNLTLDGVEALMAPGVHRQGTHAPVERWSRVAADACEVADERPGPLRELRVGDAAPDATRNNVLAIAAQARRQGIVPVCQQGLLRLPAPGLLAHRSVVVLPEADAGARHAATIGGRVNVAVASMALAALRAHVRLVVTADRGEVGDTSQADPVDEGRAPRVPPLPLVADAAPRWGEATNPARRDRWWQCLRGAHRRRNEVEPYCRLSVELARERLGRLQFDAAVRVAREARTWRRWWTAVPRTAVLDAVLTLLELEQQARFEQRRDLRDIGEAFVGLWASGLLSAPTSRLSLGVTIAARLRLAGRTQSALEVLDTLNHHGGSEMARARYARECLLLAFALRDWRRAADAAALAAGLRDNAVAACRAVAARELATFYFVVGDARARDAALEMGREGYASLPQADRLRFDGLVSLCQRRRAPLFAGESPAMRSERHDLSQVRTAMMSSAPSRTPVDRARTSASLPDPQTIRDVLDLLHLLDGEDDETKSIAMACGFLRDRLNAVSVGLWIAGADQPLAGAGSGRTWAASLAFRARTAGLPLGPDSGPHGVEVAWPVGHASAIVGGIGCCWLPDSALDMERVRVVLTAAATACAPLLRVWLDRASATTDGADFGLVGDSDAMRRLRSGIRRAGNAPYHVLIEGESGSGKELVARAVHAASARRQRRFCAVNCAALTDDLLEAELFGHTRGAFTGALNERAGLFEDATGGTLFLDEVADLSPRGQAKVLRVLQDGEVRRVGETFSRRVDVRVVAASNKPLREETLQGRFREDLRYRLEVLPLLVPPLRERREDIGLLAGHFWREAAARVGSHAVLDARLLAALSGYDWPGNVRELQNVIAHLAVHAPRRGRVGLSVLPDRVRTPALPVTPASLEEARRRFDEEYVRAALVRCAGRRVEAARALGVTRQGLAKLVERLGLERQRA